MITPEEVKSKTDEYINNFLTSAEIYVDRRLISGERNFYVDDSNSIHITEEVMERLAEKYRNNGWEYARLFRAITGGWCILFDKPVYQEVGEVGERVRHIDVNKAQSEIWRYRKFTEGS